MDIKSALKSYLRSPLGLVSLFCSLGAGLLVAGLAGIWIPLGLLGGGVFWGGLSFALIQTGAGAKAAVAQADAEERARTLKSIAEAEGFRDRLARLRIGEPRAARAAEYLVQAAGEYLGACRKQLTRSPEADAAIADSVDLIDLYLKELDEASTEKRYGLADADPFADATARAVEALSANAKLLRDERVRIDGGLPPADRMAIKEELKR
jgi:hypothetical protein